MSLGFFVVGVVSEHVYFFGATMKTQIFDSHLRLLMSMLKIPCDIFPSRNFLSLQKLSALRRESLARL